MVPYQNKVDDGCTKTSPRTKHEKWLWQSDFILLIPFESLEQNKHDIPNNYVFEISPKPDILKFWMRNYEYIDKVPIRSLTDSEIPVVTVFILDTMCNFCRKHHAENLALHNNFVKQIQLKFISCVRKYKFCSKLNHFENSN